MSSVLTSSCLGPVGLTEGGLDQKTSLPLVTAEGEGCVGTERGRLSEPGGQHSRWAPRGTDAVTQRSVFCCGFWGSRPASLWVRRVAFCSQRFLSFAAAATLQEEVVSKCFLSATRIPSPLFPSGCLSRVSVHARLMSFSHTLSSDGEESRAVDMSDSESLSTLKAHLDHGKLSFAFFGGTSPFFCEILTRVSDT